MRESPLDVSAENIEVVRRLMAAFNERDVERMAADLSEDAELLPLRAQLEGKRYRGVQGVRQMFADLDEDWEALRIEVDDLRDADERIAAVCRVQARGRVSGVELDVPMGFVWTFSGGKVVSARSYSEPDDALRAAGLE